ncbi:efflux RND transporter periplasmic adaptor subunit [Luteimonas sp. TWI1416]|uniref:efflux RND transporter periplasmic adaptor subunit n=1 Tax=unclassified Luteimonas TaxID=2629088 RepID=UPI00320BAFA8
MFPFRCLRCVVPLAVSVVLLAACGGQPGTDGASAPPSVTVETLVPAPVVVSADFPGRVAALRTAEIRPQVGGIVQRRLFEQGAEVEAGTPLFQIAPASLQADVETARAALRRAEAEARRTRIHSERLAVLARDQVVSRQMYDDVVAQRDQAQADVAQAQASLARRLVDLGFSRVSAPISGRVDQALVSEGALVTAGDSTPMATIQQIDRVYVDVRQPAGRGAAIRQRMDARDAADVEVLLDGQPTGLRGRMLFSGTRVDAGTGDVLLRIEVENPARTLLPGMYVQARVIEARYPTALSVPEEAVVRAGQEPRVWILDASDRAHLQPVTLGERIEGRYRIVTGLKAGQRLVVKGMERLQEGAAAQPRIGSNAAGNEAGPAAGHD